jgi:hypothetical protein
MLHKNDPNKIAGLVSPVPRTANFPKLFKNFEMGAILPELENVRQEFERS